MNRDYSIPKIWEKLKSLVSKSDIKNNLTSTDIDKPLSANQGKVLDEKINIFTSYSSVENADNINKQGMFPINRYIINGIESWGKIIAYTRNNGDYSSGVNYIWQLTFLHNGNLKFRYKINDSDGFSDWSDILTNNSKPFLGTQGIPKVQYIQDEGTKTQGNGYIDQDTGKLYYCINSTTDKTVTTNFELATNIDNVKNILLIKEKIGMIPTIKRLNSMSVSRDENSSSSTLSYTQS